MLLSQSPEYLDHRRVPPHPDLLTQFHFASEGKEKFALALQCPVLTVKLSSSFNFPSSSEKWGFDRGAFFIVYPAYTIDWFCCFLAQWN